MIEDSAEFTNINQFLQVSSLISELASAAAAEKNFKFEGAMDERLCAYSRAVAHFPTAVKEVKMCVLYVCVCVCV